MTARPPKQVGYKHPPEETQFKPGVSGNPRGRPKGRVSLSAVLRKALLERVEIRENGRQRMASKLEVVMKQLVNKSASGDMRAIQFLAGLIGIYAPETTEQAAQDPLEAYDQQVLDSIVERMRRAAKAELEKLLAPGEAE